MALTLESVAHELATAEAMGEVCTAMSRLAHGRAGQLGRDPLADPPGRRRGVLAAHDARARRSGHGDAPRRRRRLRGRAAPGRGHDPHRRARDGRGDRGRSAAPISRRCSPTRPTPPTRRWPALPTCSRCCATPEWSTPAARASRCCSRRSSRSSTGGRCPEPALGLTPPSVEAHLRGDDVAGLRYEVMYLLDAPDTSIPAFKDTWGALGDSIVVVGGDGIWNCHVHTNDIGAAIEAGVEAGRPHQIRVTDLFEQVAHEHEWVAAGGNAAARSPRSRPRSSRSRWATASAGCSRASACRSWSPAASR